MKLPINSSLAERRRITIPVDIPQMQVIHTAELKLLGRDSKPLDERDTIWVGHVMPAELSIRHTRAWSPAQAKAPAASNAPIKFIYEIHAEPDNWLLGGQRKAQFAAKVCLSMRCRWGRRKADKRARKTKCTHSA